jgi:hypothetical protein
MSSRLREQIVGLTAAPLAPLEVTAKLATTEVDELLGALAGWLKRAAALSPTVRLSTPRAQMPGALKVETQLAPRGGVRFHLAGEEEVLEQGDDLVRNVLGLYDDDVVVLMLCGDMTSDRTRDAVRACGQVAPEFERLVVMEPEWVAALLVERARPLVPGDLDRAGSLPPGVYFDAIEPVASPSVSFRRSDPEPTVSALTDTGLGAHRLDQVQKTEVPAGPIYLCTTFLPSVTHSQRAVQRFYDHLGATKTTLQQLRSRSKIEFEHWKRHVSGHQRIDVIDRGQLEEYLAAPEYYRMPLTPAELREQIRNLERLLEHENYVLCLTPESIDIPFEIQGEEVRVRADRRNKGQPRQGRIANLAFREDAILGEFEREFWAIFGQAEPEFVDKKHIADWLRDHARRYEREEAERRSAHGDFDVFLCHNSQDKPVIKRLAKRLEKEGLRPWFDEWHAPPGTDWFWEINKQIGAVRSAAVFIGQNGLGPWQKEEIGALLVQFAQRGAPVIPVLLPKADEPFDMPPFLSTKGQVDLRKRGAFAGLVGAIRSARSNR